MSKCRNMSRRWKKLQKRLQKWYNKRTNQLNDYIEKLTYNLVKKYDTIVFEENYSTIKILIGGDQNMIFPLSRFIKRLKDKFQLYKPRSRRRTIRKTTQHKPNMPPLRTHKQKVKSQKTQLEMSKMRKNT